MSKYIKIEDIPFKDLAEDHNTDIKVLVAFASDIVNLPTIEASEDCISREWVRGMSRIEKVTNARKC